MAPTKDGFFKTLGLPQPPSPGRDPPPFGGPPRLSSKGISKIEFWRFELKPTPDTWASCLGSPPHGGVWLRTHPPTPRGGFLSGNLQHLPKTSFDNPMSAERRTLASSVRNSLLPPLTTSRDINEQMNEFSTLETNLSMGLYHKNT